MSFLAPFYIAGLLAISLPIIFHLIRRTPQKRQEFSSLMFLSPSPPRITRRSRLNNILLLILRAAALALLAFAFARPFLYRKEDLTLSPSQGRRIALLVDTSASMRRGDLWDQAKAQVEQVIESLTPGDEVSLSLFDRRLRTALTFDEWNELELGRRAAVLRARLNEASPTWNSTNLGESLAATATLLAEARGDSTDPQKNTDTARRELILISDLQQGGHVEALQGHEWPVNVVLDVRTVSPAKTTNASLQLVHESGDASPQGSDNRLRVRVTNHPGSTSEQFTVAWANERGLVVGAEPQKLYVPPGRSQVIRLAWPPADQPADRLVLVGDDSDFDNTLYVVPPQQEIVRIVYLGDDAEDDPAGLSYYLRSALADTPQRKLEFVQQPLAKELAEADLGGARLVVIAGGVIPEDRVASLRRFVDAGGGVLWVLNDAQSSASLARLFGIESLEVDEARVRDFALVSRVELEHPLFAALGDARFAGFSKIHFWKHRRVKLRDADGAHVLARFDDGDLFLFEKLLASAGGRVIVATSGWRPADSQLALSTKFVPLIGGLLQRRDSTGSVAIEQTVGEPIAVSPPKTENEKRAVRTPDNRTIDIAPRQTSVDAADRPGIYQLTGSDARTLAVNLAPDESRTAAVAATELEKWGAKLDRGGEREPAQTEERVAQHRQLKLFELENRQKIWRWLIVCALGLIAAETALAAWLTRRPGSEVRAQVTA